MEAEGDKFACPECSLTSTQKVVIDHFTSSHFPRETDLAHNPYISFPNEMIPRMCEHCAEENFPIHRERLLDSQIVQFFQDVRLTPEARVARERLFEEVKPIVESVFLPSRVEIVGALAMGVTTENSVLDILLRIGRSTISPEKEQAYTRLFPEETQRKLMKSAFILGKIPALTTGDHRLIFYTIKTTPNIPKERGANQAQNMAQKPEKILKAVGLYGKVQGCFVDITTLNDVSLLRAGLVKEYTKIHPYVPILGTVIKAWAERRRITGKLMNSLSPFCYLLLLIHFLQNYPANRPFLPVLQQHVPKGKYMREAVEADFEAARACPDSLGMLLYRFFQYYSGFDWSGVGVGIRVRGFKPNDDKSCYMLIEDPFPYNSNLAEHLPNKDAVLRIITEFRRANSLLNLSTSGLRNPGLVESSLLSMICDSDLY